MMQFKGRVLDLLSIATYVNTALAIPLLPILAPSDETIPAGAQSCKAHDFGIVTYTTHIGQPFSQETCDNATHLLEPHSWILKFDGISCYDDGKGATWMKFDKAKGHGKQINEALSTAWKGIGFNCPDY